MPDINHTWGSDINLSAAGDIGVVERTAACCKSASFAAS